MRTTRREMLAAAAAFTAVPSAVSGEAPKSLVALNDQTAERHLKSQITDPSDPRNGSYPDGYGLMSPGVASTLIETLTAAYLCPQSRYHKAPVLLERLHLAAGFMNRIQHEDGTIDLPITNFHSPPDTGFVVHNVATAACLAKRNAAGDILSLLEPFLKKAGKALRVGGIHTPNHRWVVSSALAQLNDVYPDPGYIKRIDQWLAEGIDIDGDGQYDERSTTIYNTIVDRALTVMAVKLNRPELLEPVRRNLDAMMYLLHPGYEVVTEISHRQDQYQRGTMNGYWFPLQYLAVKDGNGRYATLAEHLAPAAGMLSMAMEYPEMNQAGPALEPVPDNYEKYFPGMKVARIRRGPVSATVLMEGDPLFLTLRKGEAVVRAVRFASAFFGKGQFKGVEVSREGRTYKMTQTLEGPYYQPLDPPKKVAAGEWGKYRASRKRSGICTIKQTAMVTETGKGFRVRIMAEGTANVPLALEINLREGGKLEGCETLENVQDGFLLGNTEAVYRVGGDAIRFGKGTEPPHRYTQVRGAAAKLPGPTVYITGFTPFDHTVDFETSQAPDGGLDSRGGC